MSKELMTDELWKVIEPLLPTEPLKPKDVTSRVDDRAAPTGVILVLKAASLGDTAIAVRPHWSEGGPKDRSESNGQGKTRLEAPLCFRQKRYPTGGSAEVHQMSPAWGA